MEDGYLMNTKSNGSKPKIQASRIFPGSSAGKGSACSAGDPGLIPGLGRSPGGVMATHSSIPSWKIPMDRGAWWATVHGVTKSWI